jgi:uncharacterized RDD family membrane protein YckC
MAYGEGGHPPPYGAGQPGYGSPQPRFASMGSRFVARLIDAVLLGVVGTVLGFVLVGGAATQLEADANGEITGGGGAFAGALIGYVTIVIVAGLFYEIGLIALRGATLGKQLMGVKVVRELDGQVPGWGPAVLRWLIPQLGGLVCGIGGIVVLLSPFFDSTGRFQGWHDKVAKTFVIATR